MARTIVFNNSIKLFGQNYSAKGENLYKMEKFPANSPIQVENLIKLENSYDFNLNGFSYKEISSGLLEVIC